MEAFPYMIKCKKGSLNIVADALSRRYAQISMLNTRLMGFELVVELYKKDPYIAKIMKSGQREQRKGIFWQEGFLFKDGHLCIPFGLIRELLVHEARGEGLAGHFGEKRTLEALKEHFYWPAMIQDVH